MVFSPIRANQTNLLHTGAEQPLDSGLIFPSFQLWDTDLTKQSVFSPCG